MLRRLFGICIWNSPRRAQNWSHESDCHQQEGGKDRRTMIASGMGVEERRWTWLNSGPSKAKGGRIQQSRTEIGKLFLKKAGPSCLFPPQLCYCILKAATDKIKTNGHGCVLRKPDLQKEAGSRIWPAAVICHLWSGCEGTAMVIERKPATVVS